MDVYKQDVNWIIVYLDELNIWHFFIAFSSYSMQTNYFAFVKVMFSPVMAMVPRMMTPFSQETALLQCFD